MGWMDLEFLDSDGNGSGIDEGVGMLTGAAGNWAGMTLGALAGGVGALPGAAAGNILGRGVGNALTDVVLGSGNGVEGDGFWGSLLDEDMNGHVGDEIAGGIGQAAGGLAGMALGGAAGFEAGGVGALVGAPLGGFAGGMAGRMGADAYADALYEEAATPTPQPVYPEGDPRSDVDIATWNHRGY